VLIVQVAGSMEDDDSGELPTLFFRVGIGRMPWDAAERLKVFCFLALGELPGFGGKMTSSGDGTAGKKIARRARLFCSLLLEAS
jgi:hypothetical protein